MVKILQTDPGELLAPGVLQAEVVPERYGWIVHFFALQHSVDALDFVHVASSFMNTEKG